MSLFLMALLCVEHNNTKQVVRSPQLQRCMLPSVGLFTKKSITKHQKENKTNVGEFCEAPYHRRRINTEETAKVVASVWGEDFIQFPAALAILHLDDFE